MKTVIEGFACTNEVKHYILPRRETEAQQDDLQRIYLEILWANRWIWSMTLYFAKKLSSDDNRPANIFFSPAASVFLPVK